MRNSCPNSYAKNGGAACRRSVISFTDRSPVFPVSCLFYFLLVLPSCLSGLLSVLFSCLSCFLYICQMSCLMSPICPTSCLSYILCTLSPSRPIFPVRPVPCLPCLPTCPVSYLSCLPFCPVRCCAAVRGARLIVCERGRGSTSERARPPVPRGPPQGRALCSTR